MKKVGPKTIASLRNVQKHVEKDLKVSSQSNNVLRSYELSTQVQEHIRTAETRTNTEEAVGTQWTNLLLTLAVTLTLKS